MGRQTVASVPMILALLHLYSSIRCTSHAKKENHTLYTAIAQIRKKRERERERERERGRKKEEEAYTVITSLPESRCQDMLSSPSSS